MMKRSVITLAITMALTACNHSDDTTTNSGSVATTKLSGHFIDEAVKGLYFKTETTSGCTDEDGTYFYNPGETITFSLGKCDEKNNPVDSDDNLIVIGNSASLSTVTPYDLTIANGAHAGKASRPNDVARLLKSFSTSDSSERLDISGVKFTDNSDKEVIEKIQKIVNAPIDSAISFDEELKSEDFVKIQNINSSNEKSLTQKEFVSKDEAEKELNDIVKNLPSQLSSDDLIGKNIKLGNDYLISFLDENNAVAYELYKSGDVDTTRATWEVNQDKNLVITLRGINPITISLVSKNTSTLSVYNRTESQGETWKMPVTLANNSDLSGTYKSNRHTFTINISGEQITYKDVEEGGETVEFTGPYSVDKYGQFKADVSGYTLAISAYDKNVSDIVVLVTDPVAKGELFESAHK